MDIASWALAAAVLLDIVIRLWKYGVIKPIKKTIDLSQGINTNQLEGRWFATFRYIKK